MSGLNRPKWEEDQIKSFTTWSNFTWGSYQRIRGRPVTKLVENITTDFRDGTKCAMLLMVLYQKPINGLKKSTRTFDHIQNWAILLTEIKKLGIDFRGGASELANGDLKTTLALQWAFIRHSGSSMLANIVGDAGKVPKVRPGESSISDESATPSHATISGGEGEGAAGAAGGAGAGGPPPSTVVGHNTKVAMKDQLLGFFNSNLPPNLQVTNFTNSFASGKVLREILRIYAGVEVEDSDKPEELLQRCFDVVERELGVPPMFSPHDLASGGIKEEPVITYIISILQAVREKAEAELRARDANNHANNANEMQALEQYYDAPEGHSVPAAQHAVGVISGTAPSGFAMNPVGQNATGGNQNYLGTLVQGSVPMELPPIFAIVAYADFNNFLQFCDENPNDVYVVAEPYHITVLHTASRITPHVTARKFMDYILNKFPSAHQISDRKGNFPMHEALEYGCKENFEYLQTLPNAPAPHPITLLHASVWPDTTECLDYMLNRLSFEMGNQPVDYYVHDGRTPLMTAVSVPRTSTHMIQHLLQRGSNPCFTPTPAAPPPFVAAAACERADIVEVMLRESMYKPINTVRMLCALMCIGPVTPSAVLGYLTVSQVNLNVDDDELGRSPLELAISIARPDLAEALIQHGADVNRPTMQTWRSPIHYALRYYETDNAKYGPVVAVLQKYNVSFSALDINGYPAFEYARRLGINV